MSKLTIELVYCFDQRLNFSRAISAYSPAESQTNKEVQSSKQLQNDQNTTSPRILMRTSVGPARAPLFFVKWPETGKFSPPSFRGFYRKT